MSDFKILIPETGVVDLTSIYKMKKVGSLMFVLNGKCVSVKC